jgi:hypothetical protein
MLSANVVVSTIILMYLRPRTPSMRSTHHTNSHGKRKGVVRRLLRVKPLIFPYGLPQAAHGHHSIIIQVYRYTLADAYQVSVQVHTC